MFDIRQKPIGPTWTDPTIDKKHYRQQNENYYCSSNRRHDQIHTQGKNIIAILEENQRYLQQLRKDFLL